MLLEEGVIGGARVGGWGSASTTKRRRVAGESTEGIGDATTMGDVVVLAREVGGGWRRIWWRQYAEEGDEGLG